MINSVLYTSRSFILSKTKKFSTIINVSKKISNNINLSSKQDNSIDFNVNLGNQFKVGQEVNVKIVSFGPLGASVSINNNTFSGLIFQKEISNYRATENIKDVYIGDELKGFVIKQNENNKIDVSLRPIGFKRILTAKEIVLEALEGSPIGRIPIGDKSEPETISLYFHGMSKSDFKTAVGVLYREGLVKPGPLETILLEENERISKSNDIKDGKVTSNKVFNNFTKSSHSIFIGNLPVNIKEITLINQITATMNIKKEDITAIRVVKDEISGVLKGFGYIEFSSIDYVNRALSELKGIMIGGRKARVDNVNKSTRVNVNKNKSNDIVDKNNESNNKIHVKDVNN